MPRVEWPLRNGRPCIEIFLTLGADGQPFARSLLADTGAGSLKAGIDMILEEDDCLHCGGNPEQHAKLGGAYVGSYPI